MEVLSGGREQFAVFMDAAFLVGPVMILLALSAVRFLVRREWATFAVGFVLLFASESHWRGVSWFDAVGIAALLESVLVVTIELVVLVRYGLLALAATFFFAFLLQKWPFTLDMSAWYGPSSLLLTAVLAAVSLCAFRIAISGRRSQSPFGTEA